MVTGTVKWFRLIKGLSFITLDESGPDAFVHIPGIGRTGLTTLQEGRGLTSTCSLAEMVKIYLKSLPLRNELHVEMLKACIDAGLLYYSS